MIRIIFYFVIIFGSCSSNAVTDRYKSIASRYVNNALDNKVVADAKMQGECLVQLKELTFKKQNDFDPIAEWINYRSISLLEKYSPCETLIILEVANEQLRQKSKPVNKN